MQSYYLKGWLKRCHEPVWPAVSTRPARKALRQLTVLVVGLCCLFSLRLISHGWTEICWRVGGQTQNKQKNTQQHSNREQMCGKTSSPSYLEKQVLSREILCGAGINSVSFIHSCVSTVWQCTLDKGGRQNIFPFNFFLDYSIKWL